MALVACYSARFVHADNIRNGICVFSRFLLPVHCFSCTAYYSHSGCDSCEGCKIHKIFAEIETKCQGLAKNALAPLKRSIFTDLSERLKEVNGDVLEIGIGAGENFLYYPQGTSLIAVDPNPHVEKLLRGNLEKIGDRIHLKKFVVASAEDMSYASGELGVEDNSVAAVVCTFLLCSLTDEQTTKTLQEVKSVLLPVSNLLHEHCILSSQPPIFTKIS